MTALLCWWAISVVATRCAYAVERRHQDRSMHRRIRALKVATDDDAPYVCPLCARVF